MILDELESSAYRRIPVALAAAGVAGMVGVLAESAMIMAILGTRR